MQGDIPRAKAGYLASLPLAGSEQVQGTGSYSSEYHLGLLCEAEQDLPQAMEHYARGLRAKPAYHQVLARCVDLIVEQGTAPTAAILDACDRQRFSEVYTERYAVLAAEGRTAEAVRLLHLAQQIAPELGEACRGAER